jgi:hypothetical protein
MKKIIYTTFVGLTLFASSCKKDQSHLPNSDSELNSTTLSLADLNSFNSPQGKQALTNGMVGYYPFIGNANDASGNGNDGTLRDFNADEQGSLVLPTLTRDKFGHPNSAYYFNGISDWINLPHNPLLLGMTTNQDVGAPVNQFSIYLRFKSDTSGVLQTLVQSGDAHAASYSATLAINADQSVTLDWEFFTPPNGSSAFITTAPNVIRPNKWYDLVLNFSNSKFKLYLNGCLIATKNETQNSNFSTAGFFDNLRIGATGASFPIWFFKGTIDNVRFYNRDLTNKEVLYLLLDTKFK